MSAVLMTAALLPPFSGQLSGQLVAYTDALLWDGTGAPAVAGATLLVEDGRIVDVGTEVDVPGEASRVDLGGRFVMPGLINTHGHVTGAWAAPGASGPEDRIRGDLLLYARYGVTTVNSLGDEMVALSVRGAPEPGRPHARLLASGPVVTDREPAAARASALAAAQGGADWLKLRVDDNLGTSARMPWSAVEAVLEVGRARNVPVATHIYYLEDARRLLEMGTSMIAHSVRDLPVDGPFVEALTRSGVCYVPTLVREVSTFVYGERPDFFDDPFFLRHAHPGELARLDDPSVRARFAADPAGVAYRAALPRAMENLRTLHHAGAAVAFGTDSGPAGRFPGFFEHLELELMVEAGLTPAEALRSATAGAAACLGLDDVGILEPGRRADFLVLADDPTVDIAATRTLERVFVGGDEVPLAP